MITLAITEPTIGLTNRTNYLYLGQGSPINGNGQKGSRWSLTVTFIIRAGDPYMPTEGSPIYLLDIVGSPGTTTCNFAGTIFGMERRWIGDRGDHIETLTCVSLEQCFDNIEVFPARVYFNKTAGYIVNDLLTNVATGVPVIAGTISAGVTIPSAVYTRKDRLTDIFTALAIQSGFVWNVNPHGLPGQQTLEFHAQTTEPAPFTLQSSQILWETLLWKQSSADYRNRQTRSIAFGAFSSSNQVFEGDDSTDHFDVPWPVDQVLTAMLTTGTQALAICTIISAGSPATMVPVDGDTVTITPPRSPAIVEDPYTFVDNLDNRLRNQVLIDTSGATAIERAENTWQNLVDAINAEPSQAGLTFSLPTWENDACNADQAVGLTFILRVKNPGSGGNGIVLTTTSAHIQWSNFDSPSIAQTSGGTDGTVQVLNVGALPAANVSNDIYYQKGSTTIYCAVAPPTGVRLSISYNRLDADSISVENTDQVTARAAAEHGTGKYQVGVNDSSNNDARSAYLAALKDLAAFGELPAGGMPVAFSYTTDSPNVLPGQSQAISLSENPVGTPALINGTYLVLAVQFTLIPGKDTMPEPFGHMRYTVTVVNMAGVSTYIAQWENLVIIPKPTSTANTAANNSPSPSATPTLTKDPTTGQISTNASNPGAGGQWVQEIIGPLAQRKGSDLVVSAADNTKVSSAAYTFQAGDVGKVIRIVGGTGWSTGAYTINAVVAGVATLSASPAAVNTTGGVYTMADPKIFATSWNPARSAYTANQIVILTKDGLQLSPFKSGDVGYKINTPPVDYKITNGNHIEFQADPGASILIVTYFPDGVSSIPSSTSQPAVGAFVVVAIVLEAVAPFTAHSPGGDKTNIDLIIGSTQQLKATTTVTGTPGQTVQQSHDVTWKIDPDTPYGTLQPSATPAQYGNPSYLYQVYKAPASIPANPVVRLLAISKLDPSQQAVELINIISSTPALCQPSLCTRLLTSSSVYACALEMFMVAEGSGDTLHDDRFGRDLTMNSNDPGIDTWASDGVCDGEYVRQALDLLASGDNIVGSTAAIGTAGAFSILIRVRIPASTGNTAFVNFVDKKDGVSAGIQFLETNDPGVRTIRCTVFCFGTNLNVDFPADIRDDTWHTIILTCDGTLTVAGTKLYIDGASQSVNAPTSHNGAGGSGSDAGLTLKVIRDTVVQTDLHTLQFYSCALTAPEVATLTSDVYAAWRGGPGAKPASGTSLNASTWTFSALLEAFLINESAGTTIADSKNTHNMTIADTTNVLWQQHSSCEADHIIWTPPNPLVIIKPVTGTTNAIGVDGPFSIFVRFRAVGSDGNEGFGIVYKVQPFGGDTSGCRLDLPGPDPTYVKFSVSGDNDMVAYFNTGNLRDGEWHNLLITSNGNSTTLLRTDVTCYLDGAAFAADLSKGTDETSHIPSDSSAQLVLDLGQATLADTQNLSHDTLQFYNTALDATEAAALNADPFLPWR